jgi:hypothetical protein
MTRQISGVAELARVQRFVSSLNSGEFSYRQDFLPPCLGTSLRGTIEEFRRGCENLRSAEIRGATAGKQPSKLNRIHRIVFIRKVRQQMGTSRKITESQLSHAKAALAVRAKTLQDKQVEPKKFKNDPQWRNLEARVRQIARRLRTLADVEAVTADVARLRDERIARIAAEKAERKSAGGKKAKPEKEKGKDAKAAKKDKAPKKEKAKAPEKAG